MKKKFSLLALLLACLLASASTYLLSTTLKKKPVVVENLTTTSCSSNMEQIRLSSYKYSKPLLLANVNYESSTLSIMRSKVEQYIVQAKSTGMADDVSVYFRKMNDGSWFNINPEEKYNPASMSKIIFLITYLKEAETNPGVLNKKLFFEKHYSEVYPQNIKDFELKPKNYYSVKELLTYMIVYSDNDATVLLTQNMNVGIYKKLFSDFNISLPPDAGEYFITSYDFSKFFRALYNSTYLKPDLSEYALKLLIQCSFKKGMLKNLSPEIEVAHKFGERIIGATAQLHEFGIVYIDNNPYLLGVMTKGRALPPLTTIVSDITGIVNTEFRMLPHS